MTGKTTRIWVELTDEQMDWIERNWDSTDSRLVTIRKAVLAQRPRPIAVGDRVTWGTRGFVCEVGAIKDGRAWLWDGGKPWGSNPLADLTRADDEATR